LFEVSCNEVLLPVAKVALLFSAMQLWFELKSGEKAGEAGHPLCALAGSALTKTASIATTTSLKVLGFTRTRISLKHG
jgi:hypothetical protein